MSGNDSEMPTEANSQRLRDRATSAFQQRKQQAESGVSRLRDRATTPFQQRREQAERAREQLAERRDQFAGALGIDAGNVRAVQLDDRGEQIGFVPDAGGRDALVTDFAADRPFVSPEDTLIDADPIDGTQARVAPDRFDEVESRAVAESAPDIDFVGPDDLDADVGPAGVRGIEIPESRRGAVGRRARQQSAAGRQFVEPDDFDVSVGPTGVTELGIRESRRDDIAAREFEAETVLDDVDPTRDLVDDGDGFGLSTSAQRRLGARELDAQLPDVDVGVDDITLEDGQAVFEREVRR